MTEKINLSPWRTEIRFKKIFYFKLQLATAVGMAVLLILLWHLTLKQQINTTVRRVSSLQLQHQQLMQKRVGNERLHQQQQSWQQASNQILNLRQQQTKLMRLFASIHQAIPINLYLEQLSIKNQEIKLIGHAKSLVDLKYFIAKITNEKHKVVPLIQKISKAHDNYEFTLVWNKF